METKTGEEVIKERVMNFQNAFTGEHGKKVMDHLSRYCLEKSSTFVENSDRKSAFNEGARSVILEIRRWVEYDLNKLKD